MIPLKQKQSYLEATQKSQQVVRTKTNPWQFVCLCDYDNWSMAHHLGVYWKEQKEIFGNERAFLPLTLAGKGALTKDGILTFEVGFPAILPDAKSGQQVVFGDGRQCVSTSNATSKLRYVFYLAKKLAEDERAQTEGVLAVVLLLMPRVQDFDHGFVKRLWALVGKGFPVKLQAHCLCNLPKVSGKHYLVQEVISTHVRYIMELGLRFGDAHIHFEREDGEVLEELLDMGLTREGLPTSMIGGSWTFFSAGAWCSARAFEDREQERRGLLLKRRTSSPIKDTRTAAAAAPLDASSERPRKAGEEEILKRRAINVIHSRQKRERRRGEFDTLQQEHNQLTNNNMVLKAEQARLQGLLDAARLVVSSLSNNIVLDVV